MNTETEVEDNADYDGDEEWYQTPEAQLDMKKCFLDGVPATAEVIYSDLVRTYEGRYHAETDQFVFKLGDEWLSYGVTHIENGKYNYLVILGTERVLGQIFYTTH